MVPPAKADSAEAAKTVELVVAVFLVVEQCPLVHQQMVSMRLVTEVVVVEQLDQVVLLEMVALVLPELY